ncbi:MAG: transglutaminase domain-containing protein [Hadesarchaea archaeon]|nr:MAG: transglutaminase domain-containing protein [Hadesarchaea archaeon]
MRRLLVLGLVLFALFIQPLASADESTNSVVYRIQKTYLVSNNGSVAATNVVVTPLFILGNRSGWASQQVLSEDIWLSDGSYEIIPTGDNRIVQASLGTITAGESKTIVVTQVVKVDYVDPGITPDMVQGSIPADELQYTQHVDNLWESDDSTISSEAHELTDNYSNYYHKAKQIFDFVKDYLTYVGYGEEEHSALWAYRNREGDCSEHTHLFVALARAAGIPAKHVSGYGYQAQYGTDFEQMGHAWAFVYLPGVEWVPIDTLWGSPEWDFCKLSPDHLVLTTSDGTNLVKEGQIKISGDCSRPSYKYSRPNPDPNLTVDRTSTIIREVAVTATLDAATQIENRTWSFYVTVKNVGAQTIENIRVEFQADNAYFGVPQAQSVSRLESGHNRQVSFDVYVKSSVENSVVQALLTYDSPYGSFVAKSDRVLASPTLSESSQGIMDLVKIASFAAIVGVVIAVAVVLVRRR